MIFIAKHKNKLNIPTTIKIGMNDVNLTDEFKLRGVLIDNKLTFKQHVQ